MHKSRLSGFIIDCETPDLEAAARFWSAALGFTMRAPSPNPADASYRALETGPDGLDIEVQQVEHPSRVHLDIETDDVAAEVARLARLGAKKVGMVRDWCVMQAPTGQRFCVVRHKRRTGFAEHANSWNDA
jgi:catechol 2,3-dioxygenase-like lactoylglutathione lyase family enzyme